MSDAATNIYITEQGASLRKQHDTVICEKDGQQIVSRPLKDISLVVLFGQVQVSTQALLALLENGSDVSLMTRNGHFRGRLVSALGKNADLRMQQYALCGDETFRLEMSRSIIGGKIANCIQILRDYHYSASNPMRFGEFDQLEGLRQRVHSAATLESLRGYEGAAARLYFSGFARALSCGVTFPGRKFHPSKDPVNAVLSFGYSFVSRELQGLMEAMGLDPYVGVYHEVTYGRASLSLDLLEEYRHHLVDRLTLKLFNKRIIGCEDFEIKDDGGWYLKRNALKEFIRLYEETVDAPLHDYAGEKRSYRYIFREQAALLRRMFQGAGEYVPFRVSS